MIDDVGQLIGSQAQVQSVQHRAVTGDGEVQLQMAKAVPAQRADAVAGLHAQALQQSAPGVHARVKIGDTCSDASRRIVSAGDFFLRKQPGRTLQHWGERQRSIHHQAFCYALHSSSITAT